MVEPDRTQPGSILGDRWMLEGELGSGGASTVWLARDLQTERSVAVKLLLPRLRLVESHRARFAQEAAVLAELAHPAIARALAWSLDGDRPYIVMEYCEGVRLDQELRARREDAAPFPRALLSRVMHQLLAALEHAHDRGIVHRDLKPINLILSSDGAVSVLDFGIARLVGESDQTTVGRVIGTYRYMSPEQMLAMPVERTTDIFSLGVLLYEMLTLERAWPGNLPGPELYRSICEGPRPAPTSVRPELDPRFDALVARATAIDPKDRPQTALAFWSELEPLLDTLPAPLDDRTVLLDRGPRAAPGGISPWLVLASSCTALMAVGVMLARVFEPAPPQRITVPPVEQRAPAIEQRQVEAESDPPPVPTPRVAAPPHPIRRVRAPVRAAAPPASPLDRARASIARAEASPADAARFRAAAKAVIDLLGSVPDPSAARRLRRMVEVAEVSYDHGALHRIVDEIDRAKR